MSERANLEVVMYSKFFTCSYSMISMFVIHVDVMSLMYLFPPASAFITTSLLPRHCAFWAYYCPYWYLLLGMSIYSLIVHLTVRIGVACILRWKRLLDLRITCDLGL